MKIGLMIDVGNDVNDEITKEIIIEKLIAARNQIIFNNSRLLGNDWNTEIKVEES